MATQTTEASVLRREAKEFWEFLAILAFDTLRNLALLGSLTVLFISVKQLKTIGMRTQYLDAIEQLHFFLTYGVLAWIGIVFFARMIGRALRK